jgi:hypothetical protein
MFAQAAQTTISKFDFASILRVGDWYERRCRECHQIGRVGIYPHREQEAMRYIARREWVCKWCQDLRREVETASLTKGGD